MSSLSVHHVDRVNSKFRRFSSFSLFFRSKMFRNSFVAHTDSFTKEALNLFLDIW